MNTLLHSFHLLRPWWLLALPPLLYLWFRRARPEGNAGSWSKVCDPLLLPYLLAAGRPGGRWASRLLPIGILLTVIALAGPVFRELPRPVFRSDAALVILLDLSRSMDATDIKPSRLERARLKVIDICRQRREGQTALIAFAAEPYVVSPLTDDTATISAQLAALDTNLMPSQGSRTDRAIVKGLELFRQAGLPRGELLLISDGVQLVDEPNIPSTFRLNVLAVGTAAGAPVPLPSGGFVKDSNGGIVLSRLAATELKQLSSDYGGRYQIITADDQDIERLLLSDKHWRSAPEEDKAGTSTLSADAWVEEGPWLLLPLLPFAAWLLRGYLWVLPLCLPLLTGGLILLAPTPAQALSWDELWSNRNHRATRQFNAEDFNGAAKNFNDPRWQAAAHYRAGDFPAAAKALSGLTEADDHYNRGNALAQAGQTNEAISAYEEALRLDPEQEDARHNLELLQKQQEQKQEQQDGQDNKDQDQEQGDQNQKQSGDQNQDNKKSSDEGNENQSSDNDQQKQSEQQNPVDKEKENTQEKKTATAEDDAPDNSDEKQQPATEEETAIDAEQRQMMEQWLRRIPDDPGGLLRRKFKYQYQQRQTKPENQPW